MQASAVSRDILLEVKTSNGMCFAYRPDTEEVKKTAPVAKAIFREAFSTTYTDYHRKSGSAEPIEKWLRLREGLTLEQWLNNTFEAEYEEYNLGKKSFIYLCDSNNNLLGWLSHSPLSVIGDLYLSQCSLEASSRNQKIATTSFSEVFTNGRIKKMFPGVSEVKLITRKINAIACQLYDKAGFKRDETIDPSIYGESYDDRYVGYRLSVS